MFALSGSILGMTRLEMAKKFDAIVTPTSPTPAFKIGEKISDPLTMYLSDIFTISANLAGIPGVSIPCGFTKNNLPVLVEILEATKLLHQSEKTLAKTRELALAR